jgi:hypothetical protein
MSTSISFHKIAKIEVSEKRDQDTFFTRTITIIGTDGRETEIILFASAEDGEPPQALDLRI